MWADVKNQQVVKVHRSGPPAMKGPDGTTYTTAFQQEPANQAFLNTIGRYTVVNLPDTRGTDQEIEREDIVYDAARDRVTRQLTWRDRPLDDVKEEQRTAIDIERNRRFDDGFYWTNGSTITGIFDADKHAQRHIMAIHQAITENGMFLTEPPGPTDVYWDMANVGHTFDVDTFKAFARAHGSYVRGLLHTARVTLKDEVKRATTNADVRKVDPLAPDAGWPDDGRPKTEWKTTGETEPRRR